MSTKNRSCFALITSTLCSKLCMSIVLASILNGCAVGPDYHRPALSLPTSYTAQNMNPKSSARKSLPTKQIFVSQNNLPNQWWTLFKSQPLNELVMASLLFNPTIEAAQEALRSSLEIAYSAKGALFPAVGVSFNPTTQKTADILTSVLANNQYQYSLYTGQVFVSYSPDVFGGVRRQLESLMAQAETQKAQLNATYLTLTANVVNAAIQESALREQISATQEIINSQKKLLAISQKQLRLGDIALIDVASQQAALASAEATLPPLTKQLVIQRDLLNALTGRYPDDPRTPIIHLSSLHLPKELPISIPSELLENRPDIRAAEAQMHAANALIGVAVANRLPNFTLTGTNLGTSATTIASLLQPDTRFWALAGIITQPIFAGGSLKHRQRAAEAAYRQTAAQYRSTIINAFQNVADTLKAIQINNLAIHAAQNAEQAARTSLNIARHQHTLGDSSIATLLINQQLYQQAKLNLIQTQANQLADTVALFQALGGGWQNTGNPSEK